MTKRLLRIATIAIGAAALTGAADGSWLRRVPANDHARVNPLTDAASAAEAGSHLYANSCAKCHGEHGQGKGSRPAVVREWEYVEGYAFVERAAGLGTVATGGVPAEHQHSREDTGNGSAWA
jgi:mono/diheme cytochrome c family protein